MERYSCTDNSPKYKGVRKRKWGKWVSEIRLPNSRERIWLGSFDSSEKAARAFDAALYCLRGPGASFNFPENPPEIPGGRSLTPQEIQAVASRFANEEPLPRQRPRTDDVGISARGENVCGGGRGPTVEEQVAGNSSNNHNDTTEYEDKTTTDWSFLLGNEVGPSEFGYFPGLDNDEHMNLFSPTTEHPPSGFYDDGGDEDSSQQCFSLWDF